VDGTIPSHTTENTLRRGDPKGSLRKRPGSLAKQVADTRFYPTPKGSAEHYGRPRENDRGDLQAAVMAMFQTPTVRDHKGGVRDWSCRQRDGKPRNECDKTLPDVATPGGQLNPQFVEWLMGFPPGWTDLDASETPSSPK